MAVAAAALGGGTLIAQLVWIRQLGLLHGGYLTAAVAVTVAFMTGLAAGAALAGRRLREVAPSDARRVFAGLCGILAAYTALSPWLAGTLGLLVHGVPFIMMPAVIAGAALPSLIAVAGAKPAGATRLYAAHALGSAAGPIAAVSLLLPALGLSGTLWCAATLMLVAGAIASLAASFMAPVIAIAPAEPPPSPPDLPDRWRIPLAALGGGLGMAFQVVAFRLTALLVTGGTLRGYAMVLSVWLGVGAVAARREAFAPAGRGLALPVAVWWVVGCSPVLWGILPGMLRPVREGGSSLLLSGAEWLAVLALAGPPAFASGTVFARLLAAPRASSPAASAGSLLAASTVGALAGGLLAGAWLIPALGLETFVRCAGGLAAAVAIAVAVAGGGLGPAAGIALVNAAVAAVFLLPRPDAYTLNQGEHNRLPRDHAGRGELVWERDAALGRIAVTREHSGALSCRVNGKPDGSSSFYDMLTQAGSAHIAMLLHPRPRRVLVIGLGTGVTAGAVARHPGVERVDVVEIEPAQLEAARIFAAHNYALLEDPRVHVIRDDARRFLRDRRETWDVVISEPSNLFVSGMVNLFTAEFHALARACLGPGGVFIQWVHYYRIDWDGWRGAVATAAAVHPCTSVWMLPFGDTLVTGTGTPPVIDLAAWEARLGHPALREQLARFQMTGAADLVRLFLWGPADTARAVAGARVCTDDRPWLEFRSERVPYTPAAVDANRLRLALHGPLEPVGLARDTLAHRLELGRAFVLTGTHERARAEYLRALAIAPGHPGAREALAALPGMRLTQERDLARFDAGK